MVIRQPNVRDRCVVALRLLLQSTLLVGVVGFMGHSFGLILLTSTVGPTACLMLAHRDDVTARLRNAVIGHGVAIGCGLACLAMFGLWHQPPMTEPGHATLGRAAASALATGLTLSLLTLLGSHHAPAAATALLISTGIARPGLPLYGLMTGLVLTMILATALAQLPGARKETIRPGQ